MILKPWVYPVPDGPLSIEQWPEALVLASTVIGEAEGEDRTGKGAVAHVVMNRVADCRNRWPKTVSGVCLQPKQFSCWDDDNRLRVMRFPRTRTTQQAWEDSFIAAVMAIEGLEPDPTGGANHYCALALNPAWSLGQESVATIGGHKFFRL